MIKSNRPVQQLASKTKMFECKADVKEVGQVRGDVNFNRASIAPGEAPPTVAPGRPPPCTEELDSTTYTVVHRRPRLTRRSRGLGCPQSFTAARSGFRRVRSRPQGPQRVFGVHSRPSGSGVNEQSETSPTAPVAPPRRCAPHESPLRRPEMPQGRPQSPFFVGKSYREQGDARYPTIPANLLCAIDGYRALSLSPALCPS